MAKTKTKKPVKPAAKTLNKAKAKPAKVAKAPAKPAAKAAAKPAKPSKPLAKEKTVKAVTVKPATKAPAPAKKAKAPKKEIKKEAEELDIFDDGDVSESEELLEYQAELEISEELEEEVETDQDDDLLETTAAPSDSDEDVVLTDADGNRYCRAKDCDQTAAVDGYCRFHYLLFWKKIQIRKEILIDGKLEKYVDDLTSRYPDKFIEVLRKDLKTTKDFLAAIAELEIDESAGENEFEEDAQTFIDEVRGISDVAGAGSGMDDDEF